MKLILSGYPEWSTMAKKGVKEWIDAVAESYDKTIGQLEYSFVSDASIIEINRKHLNHYYATDIITFEYQGNGKIVGEVFISLDTVSLNAKRLKLPRADELDRVIAHGVLHLFGFKDKTPQEEREMRSQEDKCLLLRPKNLTER